MLSTNARFLVAVALSSLMAATRAADPAPNTDTGSATAAGISTLETIDVAAERLNEKRAGIETQTGASTYTIDDAAIQATPGGDNTLLNQVVLQAPDVAQDSFGQFHVRGDHNDLQYRLNGIILPEGISVFGQSLSPRLISSLKLLTGALPAEYGLRTAAIIDLTTKSGIEPGGSVSLYGGSHHTIQPSFDYGGNAGNFSYYFSGDFLSSGLGIESPDGRSNPLHDHTTQTHGFGYFEDLIDRDNRLALILGTSAGKFEIPNQGGLEPSLGLTVNGQTDFPSEDLNENQREITHFAALSWQHTQEGLDWQTALISRYSSLTFRPDPIGDLLYDGIAQNAYKRDVSLGWQTDVAYKLDAEHTVRAGLYLQHDRAASDTDSLVLPTDSSGSQTTDVPIAITDNGSKTQSIESVYLQDEWRVIQPLVLNYGLRFDHYTAYSSGSQLSPRINAVWNPTAPTTVHAGYSRYFTPPPFELVGGETISKFVNTTAAPEVTVDDAPKAERSDYFDVGVEQKMGKGVTVGIDAYFRRSEHLIDEGQFGAPIILTPFNYKDGKVEGAELTANYAGEAFSSYANLAFQSAKGRGIETSQFNFSQDDLDYIAGHYIDLDHEQIVTASAGASYLWDQTRFSADMLLGTGLRADLTLPDGSSIPNGAHLPMYTQVNLGVSQNLHIDSVGALTLRADVINVFDKVYEIRNGTGVGVGAPQFGPRRGVFVGITKYL